MPAYQIPRISSAGSNMMIYRILRDLKDELQVFSGEESQPGFITQLAKQMTELQNGCIMPEDVMQMAEKLRRAGVKSHVAVYAGATHSFLEAVSIARISDRAFTEAARWLRDTLNH